MTFDHIFDLQLKMPEEIAPGVWLVFASHRPFPDGTPPYPPNDRDIVWQGVNLVGVHATYEFSDGSNGA